ncbi:DNA polymerase III subunit alpha [Segetibacter sp. 3557_3]|uniref:DNA polymerase III subunit alpha n=1 Tax=Segetibacter sp. 3557_3 TaxID=2547429 RepID=UPI00105888B7|nr:DNA polymerase III subunit alpha [Segetibacter sp. 3557_3]TDH24178.1 DNA polymerase III subunit alpha [Segetibacter sp. 3557_3]
MYLNCKTWFSFLYGTFRTEELVKTAVEMGVNTIALTNINSTCDIWDFVDYCRQHAVKPVAGAEIRNEALFLYILLARNNNGFKQINAFISQHLQNKSCFPLRPVFDENVLIIYPINSIEPAALQSNELIGVQPAEVNKLYNKATNGFPTKYVIRQPVTFQNKTMFNVHRLLRAIDKNIILSKQEAKDYAQPFETFVSPASLVEAFSRYPSILTNTLQVLDSCTIDMDFGSDKTKQVYSASKADDRILLEKLAIDGLKRRYGTRNKKATDRVVKELKIIDNLGFNAYFLITCDIIRYAQSRGFYHVGRGSGGNSIVAFCLQITDVDPIELDLYFERFLNPHRATPPDFDIDFSWKDRDEMTDYIFKRYGRDHVCLLGSYVTFQRRAVIRELGKVFGLPKEEIDQLDGTPLQDNKIQKQILHYGNLIKDFPNHLSVHAGGILISDEPVHQYTVTELPPKGFYTSQIDMFIAEKIGLFKLDVLSQRGLGHIKETLDLVRENKNLSIDIHAIEKFKADDKVAAQIRNADTIGCFYIESPGMRQLLKKLRCDDYVTLVAASSIIRPGVSQSGMMKQYIYRFHNPDKFEYLHPKMEELLKETYGVMVFQEDVIKVAHHFAGLDMAEADVLRRAMSGKYRGRKQFEEIRDKFFRLCKERDYPDQISGEVWRQIESFAGYSFSKAHSASFAVESYQSLFLKTYYPMEFMVAVINNFGGFYTRELYFHELKKTGATIYLPCVNAACLLTSIKGTSVYMGFIHVQGLEQGLIAKLVDERIAYGAYEHLQDFIERTNAGIEQLNLLIRIGAFRFTGKNKKELLWEANFLQKKNVGHSTGKTLFKEAPVHFSLPVLSQKPLDDAIDEIELLGFPLCNVFELVDETLDKYIPARNIETYLGRQVLVLGYLVTSKPVHTVKNETMFFHTFIDAAGDWLDTVFFPQVASRYPVNGKGFYRMKGRVVAEFGVFSIDVEHCSRIGIKDRSQQANEFLQTNQALREPANPTPENDPAP